MEMINHSVHSVIDFRTKTTKQLLHCLVVLLLLPSAGAVAMPFAWSSGTVQGVQGRYYLFLHFFNSEIQK